MTEEERRELATLRTSVAALESEIQRLRSRVDSFASAEAPESEPATVVAAPPPPTPAPVKISSSAHYESPPSVPGSPISEWIKNFFSEGNPLNKLGALSLIVGAAIVFKYAVDNEWIGPTGRVALGILVGAGLIGAGEVYARRGWKRFASGLVAGGDGVLFVAIYFGHQQYGVIPVGLAFFLYIVVTAAVAAQSLRYDAQALAVWGLLGGYLAPTLASTGSGNFVFLSTYLLILNVGVFAIAYSKRWQTLKWMAFVLTAGYTAGWVAAFSSDPGGSRWLSLQWLLPYLAAFFVSFAAIPTWRSLRLRVPIDTFGQVLTVANGVLHFAFAVVALGGEHHAWLGLVAALVAGFYALVASQMVSQPAVDAAGVRVFSGTAAGFLLLATPYLVSGSAITLVWCAETVLLAWACTRRPFAFLRFHVLTMLVVIGARLLVWDGLLDVHWSSDATAYVPFLQLRSWPPLAAAVTFGLVGHFMARVPKTRFPAGWALGLGLTILVAAFNGEAARFVDLTLAPLATSPLRDLLRAGLLVAVMGGLAWIALARFAVAAEVLWPAGLVLGLLLLAWTGSAVVWPGDYRQMLPIVGDGIGLWWLHLGTFMLIPLALLFFWLSQRMPEIEMPVPRERVQALLFLAALGIAMLLLRREVFAITHAPPLMDLFSDAARRASYRTLLSLAFALLAFAVYLNAVLGGARMRLYMAYGLYVFTAFKVYVFDLEAQNQLYRAFSLLVFAAILFFSSHFASRHQRRQDA